MELRNSVEQGLPVISVNGDIDRSTAGALEDCLFEHFVNDLRPVVLDLKDCPYMDGAGISVLLACLVRLPSEGMLAVAGPSTDLRRLFMLVGLMQHKGFRVYENARAAVDAILMRQ